MICPFEYLDILCKIVSLEVLACPPGESSSGAILATGCFDLLHVGHVRLLGMAKERYPEHDLIVGINSDAAVKLIKGVARPYVPAEIRAEMLASLEFVDYVVIFDQPNASEVLRLIRPNIWVKGSDYRAENLPEAVLLEEWGGKLEILPVSGDWSTTGIAQRIRGSRTARIA
jgi:rfaE bifunctional protein nucleotidyltransferase chain/domain